MSMVLTPDPASVTVPRDFRLLWGAQTISMFGSQVGDVALRLLAAIALAATPFQLGLLSAAQTAAFLIVSLPAGAWTDRMRRRGVLVATDLIRAVLLLTLPVAWWLDRLTLVHVLGVVFLVGVAHVFFDVAYQAYLPTLIDRDMLVEANARLESSRSIAAASGPAIAGVLAQAIRAANVIALDAVSYLVSAILLARIRTGEPQAAAVQRRPMWSDVGEGLRYVAVHPVLRALGGAAATFNLCYGMLIPLTLLLLVTELGLSAGVVGVLLASAGVGGIIGALTARRTIRRWGTARALILTEVVAAPAVVLLTLTQTGPRVAFFVGPYLVMHLALSIFNVASVSLRQRICPPELMGRVTASMRFAVSGALPLGSLIGGIVGAFLGARGALLIAAAGLVGPVAWLVFSPLRMRVEMTEEQTMATPAALTFTTGRHLPAGPRILFVYGSLTVPEVLDALLGRVPTTRSAIVSGWRAARVQDRAYPALVDADTDILGLTVHDLTDAEWEVIDSFEAPSYALQELTLADGQPVWAYVWNGSPDAILPEDWDRARFREVDLPRYVKLTAEWAGRAR